MIEGDSLEYEILEEAVKALTNPIGVSVEIGVRRGLGSKIIIDSYRNYHSNLRLNHLGIDPYGNIAYNDTDTNLNIRLDYTNQMKKDALLDFTKDYPEFNLVNLEDTEFFNRFADGYPIYNYYKFMLTEYEIVHFDGPHDTSSLIKEIDFFVARKPKQSVYILDDITHFDIDQISKYLYKFNFKDLNKGKRKRSFINGS